MEQQQENQIDIDNQYSDSITLNEFYMSNNNNEQNVQNGINYGKLYVQKKGEKEQIKILHYQIIFDNEIELQNGTIKIGSQDVHIHSEAKKFKENKQNSPLLDLEFEYLKKAIDSNEKIVIYDFFSKYTKKNILSLNQNQNDLGTHSVIILKIEGEIYIIDPNSDKISEKWIKIFNNKENQQIQKFECKRFTHIDQIYYNEELIFPDSKIKIKGRDCRDLCVKLAYYILDMHSAGNSQEIQLQYDKIEQCIYEISNSKIAYQTEKLYDNHCFIRQDSDIKIRKQFIYIEKKFLFLLQIVKKTTQSMIDIFQDYYVVNVGIENEKKELQQKIKDILDEKLKVHTEWRQQVNKLDYYKNKSKFERELDQYTHEYKENVEETEENMKKETLVEMEKIIKGFKEKLNININMFEWKLNFPKQEKQTS